MLCTQAPDLTVTDPNKVSLLIGDKFRNVTIECKDFDAFNSRLVGPLSRANIETLTITVPGVNEFFLVAPLLVPELKKLDITYKGEDVTLKDIHDLCECVPNSLETLTLRGFSDFKRAQLLETVTSASRTLKRATVRVENA